MTGFEMIQNTNDMAEKISIMVVDICKRMPDYEALTMEQKAERVEFVAKRLGFLN